jgi:hypothetical protein
MNTKRTRFEWAEWSRAMCVLGLLSAPASESLAQLEPLGEPIAINITSVEEVAAPVAAIDADGQAVIVWQSGPPGGTLESRVFGRRLDRDGVFPGAEFEHHGSCYASMPSVARAATGSFVLVWESVLGCWDYGTGVMGQIHRDGGDESAWFRIGAFTAPAVAMSSSGEFGVVWLDGDRHAGFVLLARRFDPSGGPIGNKLSVASGAVGLHPAVAMDAAGNFVVVWEGSARPGEARGVVGQRYASDGIAIGERFRVESVTAGELSRPAIAMSPSGAFVVAWHRRDGRHSREIRSQLFGANGSRRGLERLVERVSGLLSEPAVAMDGAGRFLVAWAERPSGDGSARVSARLYSVDGEPVATAVAIAFDPRPLVARPAVAFGAGGSTLIAWQSGGNVLAQWFAAQGGAGGNGGDGGIVPVFVAPPTAHF